MESFYITSHYVRRESEEKFYFVFAHVYIKVQVYSIFIDQDRVILVFILFYLLTSEFLDLIFFW